MIKLVLLLGALVLARCGGTDVAPITIDFPDVPSRAAGDSGGPDAAADAIESAGDAAPGLVGEDTSNACCTVDGDCPEATRCAVGRCMPLVATPGACWSDGACAAGKVCQGAKVCPCGETCDSGDETGLCTPIGGPGGCCDTDAECADGKLCLLPTAHTCQPPAPAGTCWNDGECGSAAESCFGVSQCPCNALCDTPSAPGKCTTKGSVGACCAIAPGTFPPCADGLACLQPQGTSGACVAPLAASGCWTDSDCAPGDTCAGAQICTCTMDCLSEPGTCKTLPPGCCASSDGCGKGQVCVGLLGAGTCEPSPGGGQCWADADCGDGESCHGALHCPCDAVCGPLSTTPGTCVAAPIEGCCKVASDCAGGESCPTKAGFPGQTWQCVPAGGCFTDADCPGGTCSGAAVCACGGGCSSMAGSCTPDPTPGCCATDVDCTGGMVCAATDFDVGRCMPKPGPGHCWNDDDCGGGTCAGAIFCGCGVACGAPDVAGVCIDAPLTCCFSNEECGQGQGCYGKSGGLPGSCKDKPTGGACWKDSDCKDDEECDGAKPCGCVSACISEPIGSCKED